MADSHPKSFKQIPSHLIPSVFEAICRDKLDHGLQPSFADITRVFTRNSTHTILQFIHRNSDELFIVFNGLLQFKYLFQYDASFGENFYGLKRMKFNKSNKKYSLLNNMDRLIALIAMLLLPYIRYKMEKKFTFYIELTEYQRRELCDTDEQFQCIQFYIKMYPYLDALLEAIHFAFKLCFLFGFTKYDTLLNWMLGQATVRIDIRDLQRWKHKKDVFKSTIFGEMNGGDEEDNSALVRNIRNIPYWILRMIYMLGNSTKIMTLAVLFGFKWVEWFFMEEDKLIQRKQMPVPPPPPVLKPTNMDAQSMKQCIQQNVCLICGHERVNSSCIPSGYVFCYNCIFPFVQKNHCCPITKLSCSAIQIRRIYE